MPALPHSKEGVVKVPEAGGAATAGPQAISAGNDGPPEAAGPPERPLPTVEEARALAERIAGDPRAAAALAHFLALASSGASVQPEGADNSIADRSGSSLTEEEPMYRWVSTKPYMHHRAWRVFFKTLDGQKKYETFASEDEALEFIETAGRRKLRGGGHPVEKLAEKFLEYRKRDLMPSSIETLEYRLDAIIRGRRAMPVEVFPWQRAWEQHIAEQSVDTQLGVRSTVRAFFRFCIEAGVLRREPLTDIKVRGRRRRGKKQLHIDEARRFEAEVFNDYADPLAAAAATMLYTASRPGEVMNLRVRDVDDGAAILWIHGTKTEASKDRVKVFEGLREVLLFHARDRKPDDFLFEFRPQRSRASANPAKSRTDALRRRMRQLCDKAEVPQVVPHSLRGLHATLATAAGETGEAVARQLRHTSFEVTKRHYLAPGSLAEAQLRKSLGEIRPATESGNHPGNQHRILVTGRKKVA